VQVAAAAAAADESVAKCPDDDYFCPGGEDDEVNGDGAADDGDSDDAGTDVATDDSATNASAATRASAGAATPGPAAGPPTVHVVAPPDTSSSSSSSGGGGGGCGGSGCGTEPLPWEQSLRSGAFATAAMSAVRLAYGGRVRAATATGTSALVRMGALLSALTDGGALGFGLVAFVMRLLGGAVRQRSMGSHAMMLMLAVALSSGRGEESKE
jgi:hypothetical protein